MSGSYQSKTALSAPATGVPRRVAARTRTPAAAKPATTREPVVPEAPVTSTVPAADAHGSAVGEQVEDGSAADGSVRCGPEGSGVDGVGMGGPFS